MKLNKSFFTLIVVLIFMLSSGCYYKNSRSRTITETKEKITGVKIIPNQILKQEVLCHVSGEAGKITVKCYKKIKYCDKKVVTIKGRTITKTKSNWLPYVMIGGGGVAVGAGTYFLVEAPNQPSSPDSSSNRPSNESYNTNGALLVGAGAVPLVVGSVIAIATRDKRGSKYENNKTIALNEREEKRMLSNVPIEIRFSNGHKLDATSDSEGKIDITLPEDPSYYLPMGDIIRIAVPGEEKIFVVKAKENSFRLLPLRVQSYISGMAKDVREKRTEFQKWSEKYPKCFVSGKIRDYNKFALTVWGDAHCNTGEYCAGNTSNTSNINIINYDKTSLARGNYQRVAGDYFFLEKTYSSGLWGQSVPIRLFTQTEPAGLREARIDYEKAKTAFDAKFPDLYVDAPFLLTSQ